MRPGIDRAKRYVILDSNIIQHFSNHSLGQVILDHLKEAVTSGYLLAISDYTFFELIDTASVEKERERVSEMNGLTRFYVKKSVLIGAAHLGCLYDKEGLKINDIGDKIIGATAIMSNSIIYTTNSKHFPRPFFNELSTKMLTYDKGGVPETIMAYYLIPNFVYINSQYSSRVQETGTASPQQS